MSQIPRKDSSVPPKALPDDQAEILGGDRDGAIVELSGPEIYDRTRKPVGHEREVFTVNGETERRYAFVDRRQGRNRNHLYVLGTHRWPEGLADPF